MSLIECNCDQDGSLDGNCDEAGKCFCKRGFDGDKCNACAYGLYGFPNCSQSRVYLSILPKFMLMYFITHSYLVLGPNLLKSKFSTSSI